MNVNLIYWPFSIRRKELPSSANIRHRLISYGELRRSRLRLHLIRFPTFVGPKNRPFAIMATASVLGWAGLGFLTRCYQLGIQKRNVFDSE